MQVYLFTNDIKQHYIQLKRQEDSPSLHVERRECCHCCCCRSLLPPPLPMLLLLPASPPLVVVGDRRSWSLSSSSPLLSWSLLLSSPLLSSPLSLSGIIVSRRGCGVIVVTAIVTLPVVGAARRRYRFPGSSPHSPVVCSSASASAPASSSSRFIAHATVTPGTLTRQIVCASGKPNGS